MLEKDGCLEQTKQGEGVCEYEEGKWRRQEGSKGYGFTWGGPCDGVSPAGTWGRGLQVSGNIKTKEVQRARQRP